MMRPCGKIRTRFFGMSPHGEIASPREKYTRRAAGLSIEFPLADDASRYVDAANDCDRKVV
jgi:hypothetical protein